MTFAAIQSARVRIPPSWTVVPFKRVAALREDPDSAAEATLLSLKNTGELAPRADDVQPPSAEHRLRYWHVDPGDLVVNPMWLAGGAIGVSLVAGAVSPDYRVYSLSARVEPRFIHHLFRSVLYRDQYRLLMRAETTFDRRVTKDDFAELPVLVPPVETQRAIVDLLDAETARVDALIEKKLSLMRLLGEWEQASLLKELGDWRQENGTTLRQYGTRVVTGPFGTQLKADEYATGGVPVINPTHIRRGRFVPEPNVAVSEVVAQRLSRHRLTPGDVVMGRKGDVGRCAVTPAAADGWLCGSDSIAIRVNSAKLLPEWLSLLLHIDLYRQQLAASSTGAMVAGINEAILLALRLPTRSVAQQIKSVAAAGRVVERFESVAKRLQRQLELLQEHRQALVTAAVTGQLDPAKTAA